MEIKMDKMSFFRRGFVMLALAGGAFLSVFGAWNPSDALRIRTESAGGYPSFVRFQEGKGPGFIQLYPTLKEMLGLGGQDQLRLIKTNRDQIGFTHYDFQQIHDGFPVAHAIYKAHFKDGKAVTLNGRIYRINGPATQNLTERDALVRALETVKAETYMWEMPGQVQALRYATGNPDAHFFPTGELMWFSEPGNQSYPPRLAWRFDIYAHRPFSRQAIFIDAENGNLLFKEDLIHTQDVQGTAVTFYSGVQSLVADSTGSFFRLRESGRADGVETYNMQNGTDYGSAVDFTDADNYWDNINAFNDHAAADGHWGAEMTFDYFWLQHGRNSFDGAGSKLLSYIHFDQNYSNAFWDGTRMTYGSANNNARPFCALDVVGHEFAHGVTGTSAGLIYQNESGALNESFSDIFGAAIEIYARPGNANWEIGEDLGGIRDMANPARFFNPDTYLGAYWTTGSFDNGGVHTNSGVQNFWFYLLTEGGSGTNDNGDAYSVSGVGVDTAGKIAFRNLTTYLTPADQYADARYYSIEAAVDLYGECSNPVIQTVNAWQAVGVGNAYTGVLSAAFYTADSSNCRIPAQVTFQNNSVSGFTYLWDFGDGNTSTDENPIHNYSSAGSYTVTLIAFGCNGSQDTLVLPAAVVVDPNAPCNVNMPSGNGRTVLEACQGNLYDSGGNLNYQPGSASTTTIKVPQGQSVTLTFLQFAFLAGDNIRIYDGDSTNAPLIGTFSGTNLPPAIVSSGNALTIRESSNAFGNALGFHATWTCAVSSDGEMVASPFVYPNPAREEINFNMPASSEYSYRLVDIHGRIVAAGTSASGNVQKLSVAHLNAGIYILSLQGSSGVWSQKIVKR
jgi:Zn-dependent metalloprotease